MYKRNEIGTLYRSFSPTCNAYIHDGLGRDMYIAYNNGGFWNRRIPPGTSLDPPTSVKQKFTLNKFPAKEATSFRYYSDGSGRDAYILLNSGGLKRDSKPLNSFQLQDFLRTPDSFDFKINHPLTTKNSQSCENIFTSKPNKELQKFQKCLINRLYNKEKHKFIPGL